LYVIGKKSDTIVVYNIAKKTTSGLHVDKLPHQASQIFVNTDFIYISCDNKIYLYKHNGKFIKTITFPFEAGLRNFFVNTNNYIIGFWSQKTFLYDNHGNFKKEQVNPIDSDVPYLIDGSLIYGGNDT
jgi:hypothetical protein